MLHDFKDFSSDPFKWWVSSLIWVFLVRENKLATRLPNQVNYLNYAKNLGYLRKLQSRTITVPFIRKNTLHNHENTFLILRVKCIVWSLNFSQTIN